MSRAIGLAIAASFSSAAKRLMAVVLAAAEAAAFQERVFPEMPVRWWNITSARQ
jgi:hypothetical protein